jgi:type-F conjugative transfer system pilin assembly thiol-disulfide isomerase TrbB
MNDKYLAMLLLLFPLLATASTRDDLAAMEALKTTRINDKAVTVQAKPVSLMALPDGRRVDMNDYAVVLFMQSHCEYSAKFDPIMKGWADQHGIRVYPYSLDGGGDSSFPTPLIPRKTDPSAPLANEIMTFFGNGLPIATPTAFVVNVHTLKAYPLTQGVMDIPVLENRYASLIQADMDQIDPQLLAPLPANTQVTSQ